MTSAPLTDAQRLAEAEDALHKLKIGRQSTEVEVDGRRVRYAKADIAKLQAYIDALNDHIAGRGPRYGGIGFYL